MSEYRKLWEPAAGQRKDSYLSLYAILLKNITGIEFNDYESLWQWTVTHPEQFWDSLFDFFPIQYSGERSPVLTGDAMPGYRWFENVRINFAENLCYGHNPEQTALISIPESERNSKMSWKALLEKASAIQQILHGLGLKKGDRVCGILTNSGDTSAALLAVTASGMIWTCCSPDFGVESIIDRFDQVQPKVMLAVSEYAYNGKHYLIMDKATQVAKSIDSIGQILQLDNLGLINVRDGQKSQFENNTAKPLDFVRVNFNDPLWVLYSSGTTGRPKALVHSHGGILLELYKYHAFHNDTHPLEVYFWYSTTGWMMWNFLHGAWLFDATVILYDGSPGYAQIDKLWQLAAQYKINHFGTSAPYILANYKAGIHISEKYDLSSLRSIGSTGSPLPSEGFDYVYEQIKPDVWLHSMSGGTDVCTAFVGGCLWKPVYEGVIQCRGLGVPLYAWDENGKAVVEEEGEMVLTGPVPSMPIYFWNDSGNKRYLESYFEMYPGVWRHGDWIKITQDGGVIIYGRSDATLNRQGIRIGTSEIYRCILDMEEIKDSLIVNLEQHDGSHYMPLFVQLEDDVKLDDALKKKIKNKIRTECSPRHVPDAIFAIGDIPYTLSGKKMEAPIKKILMGHEVDKSLNRDTMRNPESIDYFIQFKNEHL
jgi:acetoacetyl-CoA synthetase